MAAENKKDPKIALREYKELLKECNDFIKNAKQEWDEDLQECQQDYQEACRELEEEKREYEKALAQAKAEGYDSSQLESLKSMYQDNIDLAEEYCQKCREDMEKAQKDVDRFPELLKQALKDKEAIEMKIYLLGLKAPNRPLEIFGGLVIWIVIILVVLKACGKW